MGLKSCIKKIIRSTGYEIRKINTEVYRQDGLETAHNHDFMNDASFQKAYARGVLACEDDYKWHWRVHIGLWVAYSASKLKGDFVECGVNRGFLSSAIMDYLDWDSLSKTFYLMDTFSGIDERYISDEERESGILERNKEGFYVNGIELVKENFSQWKNVEIIPGPIPETLELAETKSVAYLHLDMNCAPPEIAALNHFWGLLTPGGFVLFDDYAKTSYESQKKALDQAAADKGVKIVSLPSGQGLLIKPC